MQRRGFLTGLIAAFTLAPVAAVAAKEVLPAAVDTAGGFLVPEHLTAGVINALRSDRPMLLMKRETVFASQPTKDAFSLFARAMFEHDLYPPEHINCRNEISTQLRGQVRMNSPGQAQPLASTAAIVG